jgi:hypothetical protein
MMPMTTTNRTDPAEGTTTMTAIAEAKLSRAEINRRNAQMST